MFSDFVQQYIKPLTNENIMNLYFPDLFIDESIEKLTQMKLTIIKNKIIDFKYNKKSPSSSFPHFSKVNVAFGSGLIREYGEWIITGDNNNEKIKDELRKEFKTIINHNCKFIDDNKDKILERINELYDANAIKIKEKLKQDKKIYANEKIKCECGAMSYRKNLTTHKKSQQHLNYLELIKNMEIKKKPEKSEKPIIPIADKKIEIKKEINSEYITDYFVEKEENIIENYMGDTNMTKSFNMRYNDKIYRYIEWRTCTKKRIRDWKLNGFSQQADVALELDKFAQSLGIDVAIIITTFW